MSNDESTEPCTLLTGPLHYLLQVLLVGVSLTALYLKNKWENITGKSNRTFLQFLCDSFKQLLGAAWMHVLNLAFANIFSSYMTFKVKDECNWYWIEIMIDTTLGVFIEYWLLLNFIDLKRYGGCFDYLATQVIQARSLKDPEPLDNNQQRLLDEDRQESLQVVDVFKYILQVLVWLCIVTLMKLMMCLSMIIFAPQLQVVASFVLAPFVPWRGSFYDLELLVVMILTPAVMDAFQLILQDNIFLDIDTGSVLEYEAPQVESNLQSGFNLTVKQATKEVREWKDAFTYLLMDVRALRFELDYARSGFISRIITVSIRERMKDGKPGLYRVVKKTKIYNSLEGNYVLAEAQEAPREIQEGLLVEVTEFAPVTEGSKERMAKIEKTAMNPAGWIRVVDELGTQSARFVAPPETAA
mmetsp:Transcript_37530/g.74505  ORF Transcript_37530/g.74505 Transcript_37530/m.74505 type:complete len:413 (+) Transcript_37530:78-1316(+)